MHQLTSRARSSRSHHAEAQARQPHVTLNTRADWKPLVHQGGFHRDTNISNGANRTRDSRRVFTVYVSTDREAPHSSFGLALKVLSSSDAERREKRVCYYLQPLTPDCFYLRMIHSLISARHQEGLQKYHIHFLLLVMKCWRRSLSRRGHRGHQSCHKLERRGHTTGTINPLVLPV